MSKLSPAEIEAVSICYLAHEYPAAVGDRRLERRAADRPTHPEPCRFCRQTQPDRLALVREGRTRYHDADVEAFHKLGREKQRVLIRSAQEESWLDRLVGAL